MYTAVINFNFKVVCSQNRAGGRHHTVTEMFWQLLTNGNIYLIEVVATNVNSQ
jgi:hypothetical protein